jgi:SAM-dependent methyltransferase
MAGSYGAIAPGGHDTGAALNLERRLDVLARLAGSPASRRILDAGCGSGVYVEALIAGGADAYGVEFDGEAVTRGRARGVPADRISQGDLGSLDWPADSFDVVLLNEVLEHVPDDDAALVEIRRVLRDGGHLVVFSPNRLYPFETHGCTVRRTGRPVSHSIPGIPYVPVRLGRRFLRYHARNYWPWELRRKIRAAGFHVEGTEYVWQTFEGIGHDRTDWITHVSPILRRISLFLNRVPGVRAFGISQVVTARR